MKFYQVIYDADAAAADVFFPTRKEAEEYINDTYELDEARIHVHEHKGPLTKDAVCKMLTYWPQR